MTCLNFPLPIPFTPPKVTAAESTLLMVFGWTDRVFTDEQRPESWGADARDLCDIVNIVSAGDTKLALPFYTIEDMLSEMAFNRFTALYSQVH